MRDRLKTWLALLLLVAATVMAHSPEIGFSSDPLYFTAGLGEAPGRGLFEGAPGWNDPNAGVTTQALGGLAARQWLRGRVPWWNPYSGVGLPLAAEMSGSALFLPFVLLLGSAAHGVLMLKFCMQVLAGAATFALLRQLGIARRVAVLGGILYELNGTFALMAHAPIMPVPFLPLLLYGIERALARARGTRSGGWRWIAVAIAYSLYAGFPETAFIDGIMACAWTGYRLATARPAVRWPFVRTVAGAGLVGVLLAIPVVLPFLELLPQAYVGLHGALSPALVPANYAMFLAPYLLGPIDYDAQWWIWPSGYFTLSLAYVATLALVREGREFGLRVMLAAWIVLAFAKSANLPGVADLWDVIPGIRDVFFARFAPPSWELAGTVLVAFTLDDYHRGRGFGADRLMLAAAVWVVAGLVALLHARPTILAVLHDRASYPPFLWGSLASAVTTMAMVAGLLGARRGRPHTASICGVLALEAIAVFAFPLLAGTGSRSYDRAAVAFLRANLGLHRFYTLGPFAPNYGALFGVASIDHNYLPIPRLWVDYVRRHLDPGADAVAFTGTFPEAAPGQETRREALGRRLSAYQAVGVKYVLTPPGIAPYLQTAGMAQWSARPGVQVLAPGQGLSGAIPGSQIRAGSLTGVAVVIGTYVGTADGLLTVRLCTARECVDGSTPLAIVADNATASMPLTRRLEVRSGEDLAYRITHVGGTHGVAVYLSRQPAAGGGTAAVTVTYAPPSPTPRLVYRDAVMDIYELPAPSDYFAAQGGPCALVPVDQQEVHTQCASAARLVRRELFFPDWRATVNGRGADVTRTEEIFQQVALPAGAADVRFSYAPSRIGWSYAGFGLGLGGLLFGFGARAAMRRGEKAAGGRRQAAGSRALCIARRDRAGRGCQAPRVQAQKSRP